LFFELASINALFSSSIVFEAIKGELDRDIKEFIEQIENTLK